MPPIADKLQIDHSIHVIDSNDRRPPKFGAASPQAVKKLLSLSEQTKTRPHQPRQFNNLISHGGAGNASNSFGLCTNSSTSIGLGKLLDIICETKQVFNSIDHSTLYMICVYSFSCMRFIRHSPLSLSSSPSSSNQIYSNRNKLQQQTQHYGNQPDCHRSIIIIVVLDYQQIHHPLHPQTLIDLEVHILSYINIYPPTKIIDIGWFKHELTFFQFFPQFNQYSFISNAWLWFWWSNGQQLYNKHWYRMPTDARCPRTIPFGWHNGSITIGGFIHGK